ncbi:MAG: sigma-54 dependent transcriptional regulator, partial [Anaerovoracaceae bacterium]
EDLTGTEVLSVLLTKEKGRLYFSRFKNSYTQAILVAESMGKEIDAYALDQFSKGYEAFTLELLTSIKEDLNRIDQCYHSQYPLPGTLRQKSKSILLPKEGRVDDFIFSSPVTDALIDETLNIADYDCNVIIQGETGVGKEKVLSLIHKNSARKAMHCVKINCATIQESLAESEFFGYEAGAFTGAQSSGKKGYFEVANGGIMFLDEIGALSLNLQSKLLRVLQENQFFKVGGINPININVRVICANNVPLRQLVEEGKFREDLYYRLNICTITVPPLRERQEDIITLAQAFLRKYCKRYGSDKELDSSALQKLVLHDWPGNVRELENLIHRSVINVKKHIISEEDIQALLHQSVYDDLILDLRQTLRRAESINFDRIVADQEKQLLTYALKKCGSTRKAAEFLHMSQPKLMRKKQKYQLT